MALEQGLDSAGARAGHDGGVRALEHVGDAGEAALLRAGHGGAGCGGGGARCGGAGVAQCGQRRSVGSGGARARAAAAHGAELAVAQRTGAAVARMRNRDRSKTAHGDL